MRSTLFLSFLAALPMAVLAEAEPEHIGYEILPDRTELVSRALPTSSSACPKKGIHIIAGPGAGGTGTNDYGYLNTTITALQHAIPGSNNFCLGPYVGANGLTQTENGEHQARVHLEAFHKKCPKTPIAFVGYSSGAIASMNLLCGSSPSPPWKKTHAIERHAQNIFAMSLFGIETFTAGMPFNRGNCKNNAPMYPRTSSNGCKPFWPHIRSYCDAADGDCCAGGVDGGPAHFAYPERYNKHVVKFITGEYKQWKQKFQKKIDG